MLVPSIVSRAKFSSLFTESMNGGWAELDLDGAGSSRDSPC